MSHPEMLGKQLSNDLDVGHGGRITSTPVMAATPNPFSTRSGSNFRPPNSVFDSNGTDSVIDLKLERLADHGDAIDLAFTKGAPMLSSSMPQKRVRASGLGSQIVFCQVYGCNKDLSSGKDYHKRHRVCEVHSKTATVIVKGIEQRFCQQCSRFHLLAEFDDGKRSCRKRLAGHNERRRKPQTGIHTGKGGRLLQPCGDSRFQGGMLNSSSYIGQAMLPSGSGVVPSEEYGMNGLWGPNKAEHGTSFRATSTIGSICDNNIQYPLVVGSQNSVSRSIFHRDTSIGCEDFNVFETTSSVQGLSEISDSFALSLLSSQSQKSSNQSSRIPLAHPLFIPSSHNNHYNMSPVSETIGISSHTSLSRVSNRFPSEMDPVDGIHLNPVLIPDNDDDEIVNFEMANGIFQGSDFTNMKDHRLSCEDGATIDLLQLSSQLQQVEHERQCLQVKQENDSFCTLRST